MLNFAAGKTKLIVRRLDLIYKLSIIACISVYLKTNIICYNSIKSFLFYFLLQM